MALIFRNRYNLFPKSDNYMKYSQWIGIAALIILIISCFLPWTYHPDLDKTFTGFFSQNNAYGKPGKVFIFFSVIAALGFIVNRVWAKRMNFFICAVIVAYACRCFIIFFRMLQCDLSGKKGRFMVNARSRDPQPRDGSDTRDEASSYKDNIISRTTWLHQMRQQRQRHQSKQP